MIIKIAATAFIGFAALSFLAAGKRVFDWMFRLMALSGVVMLWAMIWRV